MTISDIRNILEAPYNRKVWKSFIQTQFTNNNLLANDAPLNLGKSDLYTDCYSLGNYAIDDYTKIGIFEIQLADKVNLSRNRVALRNLIKSITQQVAGAMVVFVQGDKWRFSYVSKRKIRNKESNTVEDKETAPKRYTYLFGKGEKALTASIRFDRLIQKQQGNLFQFLTLNDFEEAFSVEKLSKEFFAQYKEIYDDFVEFITGKRYIKKGSKWVETPTHEAHFQLRNYFNNDEKQARDFFKRMMGRIVFLYFIQKKGWLACPMKSEKLKTKNESDIDWGQGDQDFMQNLFKNAKYKECFYSDYLVPLFFTTLNNPDGKCDINDKQFINNYQLTINNYFPYLNGGLFDKAQDFKYDKIALPSEIFEKLFNTFNNYNFTIYEDAPDEHTVAVDPEMLGHIFENLLEDNKDKGAFYTPKDIVHYMCRESLHNYIYTYTGNEDNEDFKTKLKQYNDNFDISIFDSKEIKLIDRALEDVKICDPAIGSGAFPMGLLHEIYHLKIPIEDNKGMKAKSPADLKKHIIEESIYGVDIDSGAVDIARLRFWLSLVVDEVAPQPLPNLAFKIVCANTLIPLGKPKGDLSGSQDIATTIEKLRHDYFDASKEDKKDLERQFKNLQNKLWATAKDWVSKEDGDIYLKISEFNPFEDKSCTWFDAWWMFGVKDGFDIVIGNPPYINVENLDINTKKHLFENYETCKGRTDIYVAFIEKAMQLLNTNGNVAYIIPYPYTNQNYGSLSRKMLIDKYFVREIVDTSEYYVFENASVKTIIISINKSVNKEKTRIRIAKTKENFEEKSFTEFTLNQTEFLELKEYRFETKNITDALKLKIEIWDNSIRLDEICLIAYGARLNHKTKDIGKDYFIHNDFVDGYKPFTEGKNIERYSFNQFGWLNYQPELHYNSMFTELFENEKIFFINVVKDKLRFAFDNKHFYNSHTVINCVKWNVIKKATHSTVVRNISETKIKISSNIEYKYLLGILNSTLINWYFINFLSESLHFYPDDAKSLPIKSISINQQTPFITLVDYLLYLHNKETPQILSHTSNTRIASHLEDILNMMVYELYFEEHMKKVGIDVLQFINPKPIDTLKSDKEKAEVIQEFYEWYQKPDNAVRQRMLLVDTRSKDIIGLINKSL